MASKLWRMGGVLAALLVAVAGHGEGSKHALSARAQARAFALRQALAPAPLEPPPACADSDLAWEQWRHKAVVYLVKLDKGKVVFADDASQASHDVSYLDRDDVTDRATFIAGLLDSCADAKDNVVGNLRKFVDVQRNATYVLINGKDEPQHQFGHGPDVTDAIYLDQAKDALRIPSLLQCPDFLRDMSDPSTYVDAWNLVADHNAGRPIPNCQDDSSLADGPWIPLVYRSQFLGVPDDSDVRGRFFVMVPGKDYDRWIQFGIRAPGDLEEGHVAAIRNVSIVARAVQAPASGASAPFDAIADFFRCRDYECEDNALADPAQDAASSVPRPIPANAPIQLRSRKALTGESDDCVLCHKMLPIGIHPEAVYQLRAGTDPFVAIPDAAASTVKSLNNRILDLYRRPPNYKVRPDPADALADPALYGGIGMGANPADYGLQPRSDQAIQACAAKAAGAASASLSADSLQRVKGSMTCSFCHNQSKTGFGLLNYPVATERQEARLVHAPMKSDVHDPNLVASHIHQDVMPIDTKSGDKHSGKHLSAGERDALYACLSNEYFTPSDTDPQGLFVDWLQQQDSADHPPPTLVREQPVAASRGLMAMMLAVFTGGHGGADFEQQCSDCHSTKPGEVFNGPSLAAVAGRRIASDPGYGGQYSSTLLALGGKTDPSGQPLVWNKDTLSAFLASPDAFAASHAASGKPDMRARVADADTRAAIVAYLLTLK